MKSIIRCGFLLALTSMAACTGLTPPPASVAPVNTERVPDRADAVLAVAGTAASIADALQVAPPSTVTTKTAIDEKAVRIAFLSYRGTVRIIGGLIDSGQITPGSVKALAIKRGNDAAGDALRAASLAQRAGAADSYSAALRRASEAVEAVRVALTR